MLKTEGLTKYYGKRCVVDKIDIEVGPGEIVGLLGPNGAGKTTTFYMVMGLIPVSSGRITLDGEDITSYPIWKRATLGINFLAQEPSIFRKLTVFENLKAILELLGKPKEKIDDLALSYLKKLKIEHLQDRIGYTLSGGERRRVEIARALATSPKYLLLDEPFTGIDPIARADLQEIIKSLSQEGLGILISDHNVRETLEITDRAYIIYDSKVLISGTAKELISDPRARELYLGEKFRI
ncbi:LPS export ABC transporter ATP-binding protein [candidate division WOR-3 bacterium]|uniref:LPS export ABC transporter ATP-binding protein n=1 Tax=candidate division WOR-3 bacterium TaxID=2052148 RepID=A0A660SGT7_UNCW3|nr:MAG: LPS export ABC transporter ATP-binding protein [candidate division WOR-3 bacterium]